MPILYENKKDCCACGACMNICPKRAISMKEDEFGFLYPCIDEELCVECGLCKRVCAYQNSEVTNEPIKCFAAVSKNLEQRKKSASGGIFAALATKVIQGGGIAYGAAFDDEWNVVHMAARNLDELTSLQGSKYVQSKTGFTFSEVKTELNNGKKIIYSGTPCQIDGLKHFLGKEYDNLLTVDIVCHGVPSNRMFKDYICSLERSHHGKVTSFTFRDKELGWGINGSANIGKKNIKIWKTESPYLYYFSNASIYRENCYSCKYACSHRPADITIGDFWGIEKQHPDLIKRNTWNISGGISLAFANTQKGVRELESSKDIIELETSEYEFIAKGNDQLNYPCKNESHGEMLGFYRDNGWLQLEKSFYKKIGIRRYKSVIKSFIPNNIKTLIKRYRRK